MPAKEGESPVPPVTVTNQPAVQEPSSLPVEELKTPRKPASVRKKRKKDAKKEDPDPKMAAVASGAVAALPQSPPPPPDPKVLRKSKLKYYPDYYNDIC